MPRTYVRRGASSTIVLVALLAVGGLAAWFFISKPFQTEVKDGFRQATEWTPENIQKNPIGYLTWALDEVNATEQKLLASSLGLRTKKIATGKALEKQEIDLSQYEKLLTEFKDAYRSAESSKKFPVVVHSTSFDESAVKRKIVEAHDKVASTQSLIEAYKKTYAVIDNKLGELDAKLADVTKLKNRLGTDLEIAKVNKSVDGLNAIDDQLSAIVNTSSALVRTTEESTSIDSMIKQSAQARVDDEFSKIMNK